MKRLDSAPQRGDRGIRLLARGRISEAYEHIARRELSTKRVNHGIAFGRHD